MKVSFYTLQGRAYQASDVVVVYYTLAKLWVGSIIKGDTGTTYSDMTADTQFALDNQ